MRKLSLFILVLVICLALSACSSGVSQTEYDSLKQKYDALQNDYDALKKKSESADMADDLNDTVNDLDPSSLLEFLHENRLPASSEALPYISVFSKNGDSLTLCLEKGAIEGSIGSSTENAPFSCWFDEGSSNTGLAAAFDDEGKSAAYILQNSSDYYVFGVACGDSTESVISAWGTPDQEDDGRLSYCLDGEGQPTNYVDNTKFYAVFDIENDQVKKITIAQKDFKVELPILTK